MAMKDKWCGISREREVRAGDIDLRVIRIILDMDVVDHAGKVYRENIEGDQGQLLLRGRQKKKILGRRLKECLHRK